MLTAKGQELAFPFPTSCGKACGFVDQGLGRSLEFINLPGLQHSWSMA